MVAMRDLGGRKFDQPRLSAHFLRPTHHLKDPKSSATIYYPQRSIAVASSIMAATSTSTSTTTLVTQDGQIKDAINGSQRGSPANSSSREEFTGNTTKTDPCSLKGLIGLKKRAIRERRLRVQSEMADSPHLGCPFLTELSEDELRETLGPCSWTWFMGRVRSTALSDPHPKSSNLTDVDIGVWKVVLRRANHDPGLLFMVSDILIMFLNLHDEACGSVEESRDKMTAISIRTATELWSVVEGELGEVARAEVAETVLSELFQERRSDGVKAVVDAYKDFVSSVVFCEPAMALSAIEGICEDAKFRDVQVKAWTDMIKEAVLPIILAEDDNRQFEVEELIGFLRFPYKIGLQLSVDADKMWDELLFKTLSLAESANKTLLLFDLIKEIKRGGMDKRRSKKRRADEGNEEGTSATSNSKRTRRDGGRASE